jgi:hypothetical protein
MDTGANLPRMITSLLDIVTASSRNASLGDCYIQ